MNKSGVTQRVNERASDSSFRIAAGVRGPAKFSSQTLSRIVRYRLQNIIISYIDAQIFTSDQSLITWVDVLTLFGEIQVKTQVKRIFIALMFRTPSP